MRFFVDLARSYGSLDRPMLFEALVFNFGVYLALVRAIVLLHQAVFQQVVVDRDWTSAFEVMIGIH